MCFPLHLVWCTFAATACIDDDKVDCAYLNAMFDICKDVNHSKNVCPKFCGLCTLGMFRKNLFSYTHIKMHVITKKHSSYSVEYRI